MIRKVMSLRSICLSHGMLLMLFVVSSTAQAQTFETAVSPLLKQYCYKCHSGDVTEADVDLSRFTDAKSVIRERKLWLRVLEQIKSEEMPPEEPFPKASELKAMIAGVDKAVNDVDWDAIRNPGHVPLSRLSRLQYRNSVRDLLGIDFNAGLTLPEDPEGPSGFRNDRTALLLSGSLLEKYYTEAQRALDALFYLDGDNTTKKTIKAKNIKVFRARIDTERVPPALLLNAESSTGSGVAVLPETGYYRVTIRASGDQYPLTGLNLYADGIKVGDVIIKQGETENYSLICLMEKGSNLVSLRTDVGATSLRRDYSTEFPVPDEYRREATRIADASAPKLKPLPSYSKRAREMLNQLNKASYDIFEFYQLMKLMRENDAVSDDYSVRGEWLGKRQKFKRGNMELAVELKVSDSDVFSRWTDETISLSYQDYENYGNAYVEEERLKFFNKRPYSGRVYVESLTFEGPVTPDDHLGGGLISELPVPRENERKNQDEWAKRVLRQFATRAFRQVPDAKTLAKIEAFYTTGRQRGDDCESSLKDALTAVLCSPEFIYRFDSMGDESETRLTSFQLSGRLANFLWGSVPDDDLLKAATDKPYLSAEDIETQVQRMRRSDRVRGFVEPFTGEWLDYSNLGGNVMPHVGRFPEFSRDLASDMKREVARYFETIVKEDRSLLELLDSDYVVVNQRMANFYGLPNADGIDGFMIMNRPNNNYGGLLGMSGLMTVTSSPTRTSPVKRGVWMLEKILGEHLPPPPMNVPELPAKVGEEGGGSLREELARHRADKSCASCHDKIDDFGFALENFSPIGKWRESTASLPVESTVTMPNGRTYNGVTGIKEYLLEQRKDDFIRNLTERMLAYALGRPLEYFDTPAVDKITKQVIESGYKPSAMMSAIATSYPFNYQNNKPESDSP
ncbi:MAG: DUF1592 domain-containing protein [Planctomycetaceae bacterium]|nr:DUF1592 domain-containing protein [Planctomycetaceae bacterium]